MQCLENQCKMDCRILGTEILDCKKNRDFALASLPTLEALEADEKQVIETRMECTKEGFTSSCQIMGLGLHKEHCTEAPRWLPEVLAAAASPQTFSQPYEAFCPLPIPNPYIIIFFIAFSMSRTRNFLLLAYSVCLYDIVWTLWRTPIILRSIVQLEGVATIISPHISASFNKTRQEGLCQRPRAGR